MEEAVKVEYEEFEAKPHHLSWELIEKFEKNENNLKPLNLNSSVLLDQKSVDRISLPLQIVEEYTHIPLLEYKPIILKSTYKCNVCKYVGSSQLLLAKHLNLKHYKCDICLYCTTYPIDFEKHVYNKHPGVKPYKCTVCSSGFMEKPKLVKHMKKHTGKAYRCAICPFTTDIEDQLRIHHRMHSKNLNVNHYSCQICPYATCYAKCLQVHMQTHEETPHKCPYCTYSNYSKRELNKHIPTHSGKNVYKCKFCNYSGLDRSSFADHRRTHRNEKPYKCTIYGCNYACQRQFALNNHILKHSNNKLECNQCSYKTFQTSAIKRHMIIHNFGSAERFKCNDCNYSTIHKRCLKVHAMRHIDISTFTCFMCGFSTKNKGSLIIHIRTHANKNHECNKCDYKTSAKKKLQKHMKIHK